MMTSPIVCTGDPDGAQRHAPYASVSCVRAKLRWPLSLGAMHCRDYVRCVLATLAVVYSRMRTIYLTTCPYRVWHPVTRLGPSGFAPAFTWSVSTCEYSAFTMVLWFNAVTFLPQALYLGTHTVFSWQGTTLLFYDTYRKVEIEIHDSGYQHMSTF